MLIKMADEKIVAFDMPNGLTYIGTALDIEKLLLDLKDVTRHGTQKMVDDLSLVTERHRQGEHLELMLALHRESLESKQVVPYMRIHQDNILSRYLL